MSTDTNTTTDNGNEEETDLVKDLRKQLKLKDKTISELKPLKETNLFLEAGLGKLSADHKAALKAVAGEEPTQELLLEKAKLLGFISEQTDEEKEIETEVQTINDTEKVVSKSTAKPDTRDFTTRITEAKSQDEVMALIASEGQEHGLLVEDEI